MIAGSETASEASWTGSSDPSACQGGDRTARWEFKMPAENFRACGGNPILFFNFFPSHWNKRQASKASPLRRGEELLRQIGDQATLPPQGRPRWICRAMARELGASKAAKATGIYWN